MRHARFALGGAALGLAALGAHMAFMMLGPAPHAAAEPPNLEAVLQTELDALQAAHPGSPGFAVSVRFGDGRTIQAATGVADPDGAAMTSATPVRVASVTKTFVAATLLRLWEDGRLDLDAPIATLISPEHNTLLTEDGYDTDAMTVRHLAMHVGGLADHVGDAYLAQIGDDPTHVWTRTEQLEVLVATSDPLSAPGEKFAYSDTGYILLGEIIERTTDQPLHRAVREQLGFAAMGLHATWWDEAESPPDGPPARAHQRIDGADIHGWHGSLDAFGGGGLIASMDDLTLFFATLFNGGVFAQADTMRVMTDAPGHPDPDAYRIGLFPRSMADTAAYGHGGFWGIDAVYAPALDLAIAGVALDQSAYRDMKAVLESVAAQASAAKTTSKITR